MKIVIVAAMAKGRVIGSDNGMPWHLPADLQHFKAVTLGKPVIMGRKTFDSIGRPLPGRHNIVITRQADWVIDGVDVVASLDEALACTGEVDEVMIIGGGTIYQQALPLATHMELTFIESEVEGDTHFPEWDEALWSEVSRESHAKDDNNPYDYHFVSTVRL